jgi:hypothetical protein
LIDKISYQVDSKNESNSEIAIYANNIRSLIQKENNIITDSERLVELRKTYNALDKRLAETVDNFNDANSVRVKARCRVTNMREELNTHLDETVTLPVDLAEIEDLCRMIEEKDKHLMLDLMRVKD